MVITSFADRLNNIMTDRVELGSFSRYIIYIKYDNIILCKLFTNTYWGDGGHIIWRWRGTFAYCHIYGASINVLQSISHAGTDMEKPNFHPVELLLQANNNHRCIQAFYYIMALFINLHIVLLIVLRTTYFV